eukprot:301115_1
MSRSFLEKDTNTAPIKQYVVCSIASLHSSAKPNERCSGSCCHYNGVTLNAKMGTAPDTSMNVNPSGPFSGPFSDDSTTYSHKVKPVFKAPSPFELPFGR